jgi:hypothetical protein
MDCDPLRLPMFAEDTVSGHDSGMSRIPGILFLLAVGALLASCSQAPKPPIMEFVEWVQVDGSCQENHATEGAHYVGELVYWRNKATGVSLRYGSVHNFDAMNPEAMAAEVQHPNQYHPPFTVEFGDIVAGDFQSQTMVLHGVSDDPKHRAGYEATCSLAVKRRLDHLPSNDERSKQT